MTKLNLDQYELHRLHRRMERMDSRFRIILGGALLAAAASVLLWAPMALSEPDQPVTTQYSDLYQFSANAPAIAAEVNSNFATLHSLADNNTSAIENNAAGIQSNDSAIEKLHSRALHLESSKLDKTGGTVSGELHLHGTVSVKDSAIHFNYGDAAWRRMQLWKIGALSGTSCAAACGRGFCLGGYTDTPNGPKKNCAATAPNKNCICAGQR